MVFPKLEYPLAITQFTPDSAAALCQKKIQVMLPKLGCNRNLPRAVVFGPVAMGGLGLHDLYVEQGVQQILALVGYSREASETSWMMTIELEWCQVQAGAGVNLLESPQPGFDYVKPCWIMSIHAFLVQFDLRVEFTHTHRPKPLCDHDQFLRQSSPQQDAESRR